MSTSNLARVFLPVSALIAVIGYGLMWLGYRQGWFDAIDSASLSALYDVGIKHPLWVRSWEVVCSVFGPTGLRVAAAGVIVVALVQRNVRTALFLIVTVQLSGVVIQGAKNLADRPRPVTALAHASSTSFPSGHALASMVAVVALLAVLLPMLGATASRVAIATGVLIVIAVGFGRVVLNVHHPSDVVAGWALGYAYVALWMQVLRVPWWAPTREVQRSESSASL
ncbi:hypothetical protein AWC30_16120 [Mycolicibacillus trivialis]|uniref:Phosphatidic acid phosphatase type 2/haloperoxidase domain-containing protein n=1 Tax=Mycolicibacillus trivialis TaxID=1798 RepID=A0A1X2EGZ8_9MYCO|nr:hypothetical protein AWC30_16120 [Mycolicibacillus trivialis]